MTFVSEKQKKILGSIKVMFSGSKRVFGLAAFRGSMHRSTLTPFVSGTSWVEAIGHCFADQGTSVVHP
jgi:hypothetical protein